MGNGYKKWDAFSLKCNCFCCRKLHPTISKRLYLAVGWKNRVVAEILFLQKQEAVKSIVVQLGLFLLGQYIQEKWVLRVIWSVLRASLFAAWISEGLLQISTSLAQWTECPFVFGVCELSSWSSSSSFIQKTSRLCAPRFLCDLSQSAVSNPLKASSWIKALT